MLSHILRHDLRLLLADRTLPTVALLLLTVITYGVHNGARWVDLQERTIAAAVAEEEARETTLRDRVRALEAGQAGPGQDLLLPSLVGGNQGARLATLPPTPLAALSIGQSDLQPYHFRVTHLTNARSFLVNGERENPENLLAGRFDAAFAIVYLLPLLILALSYNLVSSEREQGTLAMALAQPVSLTTIVLGRILLRGTLVIGLVVAFAVGALWLTGAPLGVPGVAAKLVMWTGVVLAYAAFWFALALLVNAFGGSSATNATALAACWLGFVLLIPSLINLTATAIHPMPSRVEMVGATRTATDEVTTERSRILAAYFEDHPELAGENVNLANVAAASVATQEEIDRRLGEVLMRYDQALAAQQKIVARYHYFSPAILAQEALNDIAGSGAARYRHFQTTLQRFSEEWRRYFIPRIFREERLSLAEVEARPEFRFEEEGVRTVFGRVGAAILTLLAMAGALLIPALRGLSRYSVTG